MPFSALLGDDEAESVRLENLPGSGPFILTCDHACNRLPRRLGTLGLEEALLQSHIAWDPGALPVAEIMSRILDSPLVASGYSRLAMDVNRPPQSAGAMLEESGGHPIPGNIGLSPADKAARIRALYEPFHAAIDRLISERRATGREPVLVTVHSFTPVYLGEHRAVELGILHDEDSRLADDLLARADRDTDMTTRRNEPYGPDDGVTHTLARHGVANGILNAMLEIRSDLISSVAGQERIAGQLSPMLQAARASLVQPLVAVD